MGGGRAGISARAAFECDGGAAGPDGAGTISRACEPPCRSLSERFTDATQDSDLAANGIKLVFHMEGDCAGRRRCQ